MHSWTSSSLPSSSASRYVLLENTGLGWAGSSKPSDGRTRFCPLPWACCSLQIIKDVKLQRPVTSSWVQNVTQGRDQPIDTAGGASEDYRPRDGHPDAQHNAGGEPPPGAVHHLPWEADGVQDHDPGSVAGPGAFHTGGAHAHSYWRGWVTWVQGWKSHL